MQKKNSEVEKADYPPKKSGWKLWHVMISCLIGTSIETTDININDLMFHKGKRAQKSRF